MSCCTATMSPRGTMTSSIRRPRSARMFWIMVRSSGETPASPGPAASSTTSMSARSVRSSSRTARAPAARRSLRSRRRRAADGHRKIALLVLAARRLSRPAGRVGVRHVAVSVGARVRIRDRETLENLAFHPFHLFRVAVVFVVIAEQMQKPVNGEMREMVPERLAFGHRLARDGLIGDDDVTDIWGRGPRFAGRQPETTARWLVRFYRASRG